MLKKIMLALLLLILIAGGYVYYAFESLLKNAVEVAGSAALGTTVTVESVRLSPFSGSGQITGLRVANPEGFSMPYAMELDSLAVSLDTGTLFSDVLEIQQIVVQRPHITYETRITTDNIRSLLANLRSAEEDPQTDDSAQRRIVIRDFQMRDPQVNLAAMVAAVPVPLPDILLQDIGDQATAVTVADALRQILVALNRELVRAGVLDTVEDKVNDVRNVLRNLF